MTAIALIHGGGLHAQSSSRFHIHQCRSERVSIVRTTRTHLHAHDPVTPVACRQRHLLAEFVTLVGFPLADADHVGFVQAVELPLVSRLLSVESLAQGEQPLECVIRTRQFSAHIPQHPSQPGLELAQFASHPFELPGVSITPRHHRCRLGFSAVRLPQRDPARSGCRHHFLNRLVQQLGIGGMCDVLLLHRGIDIHVPQLRQRNFFLPQRQSDGLPQEFCESSAPARCRHFTSEVG